MSLLLLFPNIPTTAPKFCWATTSSPTTAWAAFPTDYKDVWGDWATTTWGEIFNAGYTWDYISGNTFLVATGPSTSWVLLPKATQNCS